MHLIIINIKNMTFFVHFYHQHLHESSVSGDIVVKPNKTTNENLTWKLDAHHLQLTATDVYRIKFRFVFRFERLHFSYAKLSFPINAADCGCAVSPSHFGEIWVGYRSK